MQKPLVQNIFVLSNDPQIFGIVNNTVIQCNLSITAVQHPIKNRETDFISANAIKSYFDEQISLFFREKGLDSNAIAVTVGNCAYVDNGWKGCVMIRGCFYNKQGETIIAESTPLNLSSPEKVNSIPLITKWFEEKETITHLKKEAVRKFLNQLYPLAKTVTA